VWPKSALKEGRHPEDLADHRRWFYEITELDMAAIALGIYIERIRDMWTW
jgi:hypothetical protein